MTTEQMDWVDDHRDDGSVPEGVQPGDRTVPKLGPEILYGTPTKEEMARARGRAGGRGVMVVPEEMRGLIGEVLDPDEPAPDLDPEQHFGNEHEPHVRRVEVTKRLSGLGALRERMETSWVNAPLEIVLDVVEKIYTPERIDFDGWGPIPRYAMLDIWMAVHGSDRSQEFEGFADEHGYAETWARLCAMVRKRQDVTDTEDTMRKVDDALFEAGVSGVRTRRDLIGALQNAGILFRERARGEGDERTYDDPHHGHEYDHYTERSRNLCLGGDHDAAVMWDRDVERIKVREASAFSPDLHDWHDKIREERERALDLQEIEENRHAYELRKDAISELATMAEEPIDERLARAYKNGLQQGLEIGHRAFGNWDHS